VKEEVNHRRRIFHIYDVSPASHYEAIETFPIVVAAVPNAEQTKENSFLMINSFDSITVPIVCVFFSRLGTSNCLIRGELLDFGKVKEGVTQDEHLRDRNKSLPLRESTN